jgi:DNA-binding CsgD family transcriptional regulator
VPRPANAAGLIELANEGALSPQRFHEFVGETARAVGAPSGNVQAFKAGTAECLFACLNGPNYSERALRLYQSGYMHIEPHRKFVTRDYMGNSSRVMLCHEFISEAEAANDAYFQEFLIPETGTRWLAGNLSFDDPEHAIQFGFARLADQTPFNEAAGRLLEKLTPHLRHAVKVAIALASTPDISAAFSEAFGRRSASIYLLDRHGRVVWMNEAAEHCARTDAAIGVRGGLLHASDPMDNTRLERAIREAATSPAEAETGDFDIADAMGRRIPVSVRSAGPIAAAIGGLSQARIIVLAGGHAPNRIASDRLIRLYNLTTAEARLCLDMAEGLDVEDCAARRGTRPHTARTQLKSIFAKTGVSRQAELVALVWRWAQV